MKASKVVTHSKITICYCYNLTLLCHLQTIDEIDPLNAELNPICHLLALLGAHRILHVGRMC
jgi:hypothetical protein